MDHLNIIIEDLIEKKAKDFEIAQVIKNEINIYLKSLDLIYNKSQGKDFFVQHTKQIDIFIKIMFKYLLRKHFNDYLPLRNYIPITLVALGSYGREQLCVYSDIDIMLLYEEVPGYNVKQIIEEFMALAWDSGLILGSRVHLLNTLEDVVKTDITIKTSIIESRYIYGSKILWFKLERILVNIRKFEQQNFILSKYEEHKRRLAKYPLNMEPNIKDGYGGMREANMLFWVCNILYGVKSTHDLSGKMFTEDEYRTYRAALEYIFRVRNALHLIAKKKLDRVNFDILPELSSRLGFKDTVKLLKERQCMSKLFESLHAIHNFCFIMTKKIVRQYLYSNNSLKLLRKARIKRDVYLLDGKIYSSYNRKKINLLKFIKELNELPVNICKFDVSYIYFARKITLPNSLNANIKSQILALLQKENLYPIVMMLYNSGLFTKILPSMKKIINQPQFDGFHIHPVDIHTIKALYYTHNIKDSFVKNIYDSLSSKQVSLLNLCILFHDVGKGRTKDHHVVSEAMFRKYAKSSNLSDSDTVLVSRIVRYHNQVSYVATREDFYSQKVILNFNAILETKETLDLLVCLTYGDINSVSPNLYKSSTSSLIKELYNQSIGVFDNRDMIKESVRRVKKENAIKKNKIYLELSPVLQKKILSIESNQLFLIKKSRDIIELAIEAENISTKFFTIENNEFLKIRIIRVVPLNLGYLLGKLSFLELLGMNIFMLYDEKKYFEINFSKNVENHEIGFIKDIIEDSFDMKRTIYIQQPMITRQDIFVDCNHREDVALVKIDTVNQKGLFAYIAKILDDFNIDIESAKIYTVKNRANDLLLIHKNGDFCIKKDLILEKLLTQTTVEVL